MPDLHARLSELRARFDQLDRTIGEALSERFRLAREVGEVKRLLDLPVVDREREGAVYAAACLHDEGVHVAYVMASVVGVSRRLVQEGGGYAGEDVR